MTSDFKQSVYKEYDPKFTADISKKMQMPDRLIPGSVLYDGIGNPTQYNMRGPPKFDLPLSSQFEESHYILTTPPNNITNFTGTTLADDDNSDSEIEKIRKSLWENIPKSNKINSKRNSSSNVYRNMANDDDDDFDEASIPMTPGTMLLLQKGDSLAALQRQVGKLAHRVSRLQEENRRRKACEWILYPLVIGYLFIQLGKFIFSKPY